MHDLNGLQHAKGLVCFTKTLIIPSTGTWVTFGGQISDEVCRFIRSIIQSFTAHDLILAFILSTITPTVVIRFDIQFVAHLGTVLCNGCKMV